MTDDRMPDGTPINDRTIGPLMAQHFTDNDRNPMTNWDDHTLRGETFGQTIRDAFAEAAERTDHLRALFLAPTDGTTDTDDDTPGEEPLPAA